MAKNNKSSKKSVNKNGTITLDFTKYYEKEQEYLNTPSRGTMKIPTKSFWQKIKGLFKRKK
jgi:hypothetical protein